MADETMTISMTIENTYELYEDETTYAEDKEVPLPPSEDDADEFEAWVDEHIYDSTGVGHEDGDSWYDVTITASSRPDLIAVGRTFDFGY